MNITSVIQDAVSYIHDNEDKLKLISSKLGELKNINLLELNSPDLLEKNLVFPVEQVILNEKIAGVDSGFIDKKLHSIDLVLIRAVGVVFEYIDNKVVNAFYYPGFFQFPFPHLTNNALEIDEFNCSTSLLRLKEEIKSAKELIKKYSPKYCLLDGSIIPQYLDKPRQDSKINSLYHGLLDEFQSLYQLAESKNCKLIGCVEDSRGSRFNSIIKENFPDNNIGNLFDSSVLNNLLELGERSFAFPYSNKIDKHPILMDYDNKWSEKIHALYLKPAKFDRPLRIEFFADKTNLTETANEVSSVILNLASLHREYAYPSILIEADLRARLKPEEIDVIFNKIMDKLKKNIKLNLRRDSRPF